MPARRRSRGRARSKPNWVRGLKLLFAFGTCIGLLGVIFALVVFLPIQKEARENAIDLGQKLTVSTEKPSVVVSSDGVILYSVSTARRKVVSLKSLPIHVRYAIIAAEDRRFYDHGGVDLRSLFRVLGTAVRDRRASQGGSTIEMQLAKILVNGSDRSLDRKIRDIAVAQQIDNVKSKDEVLDLYANSVYFGEGAWGIQAAAETYLGKEAKDLTISEAALLSRCVRLPSRQNPIKDLQGSVDRRNYVLGVMREEKWITDAQYEEALREPVKINPNPPEGVVYMREGVGHAIQHVLRSFRTEFPGADLKTGGYRIETSIHYGAQKKAAAAVSNLVKAHRAQRVNDAALLCVDADGWIRAEVGGPDYAKRQFNVVTGGTGRQPGSSFKPFIYAVALKDRKISVDGSVSNAEIFEDSFGKPWRPQNYGKRQWGSRVAVRTAFSNSINRAAIWALRLVGSLTVAEAANDAFGFRSRLNAVDTLALGTSEVKPIEMAEAYSVFMLRGDRVRPQIIQRILGPTGEVLKAYEPVRHVRVFPSEPCEQIDTLLRGVVESGTGTAAQAVPDARGKTGTTQDARDAWFCGYAHGLVTVGWVGNTDERGNPQPMASSVFGGTVTVQMWTEFMKAAVPMIGKDVVLSGPAVTDVWVSGQRPPGSAPAVPATPASASGEPEVPPAIGNTPDPGETSDSDPASDPDGSSRPEGPREPRPTNGGPATDPAGNPIGDPSSGPLPGAEGKSGTAPKTGPGAPETLPGAPADPPSRPRGDSRSEDVEIDVCADTGTRASMYCPETVRRKFSKRLAPKGVCRLHKGG